MQAIAAAFQIPLSSTETAFLSQKVENLIAGAPCGVMDQMTAACGESGRLLQIHCQPGELRGCISLPDELGVWGIDSGIRHAVSGADYGIVRTAAFMGYRILAEEAGLAVRETGEPGRVEIDDPRWNGYLANIDPAEFHSSLNSYLPHEMVGHEFLKGYRGTTDDVTSVVPSVSYPVYEATRHPIEEHQRVARYASVLHAWKGIVEAELLGALMYESHESYSRCGLGSDGTDLLVQMVRTKGMTHGLFGAKITGGGSGGVVAVLGRSDAEAAVSEIAQEYAARTGRHSLLISGSSPGAHAFGHISIRL
jgi:L-arabinokinase